MISYGVKSKYWCSIRVKISINLYIIQYLIKINYIHRIKTFCIKDILY